MSLLREAQEMPEKISEAIGAVDPFKAAVAVHVLEGYAKAIKEEEHFSRELYSLVKGMLSSTSVAFDAANPEADDMLEELRRLMRGER